MIILVSHQVLLSGSSYFSVSNCFYLLYLFHITVTLRNQSLISLVFFLTVTQMLHKRVTTETRSNSETKIWH